MYAGQHSHVSGKQEREIRVVRLKSVSLPRIQGYLGLFSRPSKAELRTQGSIKPKFARSRQLNA